MPGPRGLFETAAACQTGAPRRPSCGCGPPSRADRARRIRSTEISATMQQGLEQSVLTLGDCGDMEHRVYVHGAVIAVALAIGSFQFAVAELVKIALDNHLGIRRKRN